MNTLQHNQEADQQSSLLLHDAQIQSSPHIVVLSMIPVVSGRTRSHMAPSAIVDALTPSNCQIN